MRTELANMATQANDVTEFKSALKDWAKNLVDDERVVGSLMQPAVVADLAGQLFVRNVELAQNKRLLADDRRPAFLNLPFQEAVDYWRREGGSEEGLQAVLKAYRERAQGASQLMLDRISQAAVDRIEAALAEGQTLRDFAQGMRDDTIALGISPASSSYLETVYRTNVQTAYGAGRFRQLTEPAVIEARPWVQYRTAGDNRVREAHQVLDGVIFDARSDEWQKVAPPNGFSCRCSIVSLDDQDVHDELTRGGKLASSVDSDDLARMLREAPDADGFAGPPTEPISV